MGRFVTHFRDRRTYKIFAAMAVIAPLAACATTDSSVSTHDDKKSFEQRMIGSVLGAIGLKDPNEDRQNFDYSQRAPLVMPPQREALPQPQDQSPETINAEWPTSPEERIARQQANERRADRFDSGGRERLTNEELQTGTLQAGGRSQFQDELTRRGYYSDGGSVRLSRAQEKQLEEKALSTREDVILGADGVPERKYLTQPPKHLNVPVASAPYEAPKREKSTEKSGLQAEIGYRDAGPGGF
jgi:hypothetical protein